MISDAAPSGVSSKTVLVVEDEPSLASALSYNLRKNGYNVMSEADGVAGLQTARREGPDVIILDLMLPKMDGLEVCRRVRSESGVPILMLTAKGEETDKVVGLEVGADDYLTKPFSMRELMARVKALLRRSGGRRADEEAGRIVAGELELDSRGRAVRRAGAEVQLKPKEFDLLFFLARNAGQVFTREQVLDQVWGHDFIALAREGNVAVDSRPGHGSTFTMWLRRR